MKNSVKYAFITSALGYVLIVISVVLFLIIISSLMGYPLSPTPFMLELITFRFIEIHQAFVIAPFLTAALTLMLLSKAKINKRIVAGLSLDAYYLLTALVFYIKGAGEFPYAVLIPWIPAVFIFGYASSILADKT